MNKAVLFVLGKIGLILILHSVMTDFCSGDFAVWGALAHWSDALKSSFLRIELKQSYCEILVSVLPMPVSPSGVSGISACHFRTCRSFDELWIFPVGPATFKYRTGRKIQNPRTPSTMQACSFFSNSFSSLGILLLDPHFFFHQKHKFVHVFDTLKIPVHCFGTRDTLKKVICLIRS